MQLSDRPNRFIVISMYVTLFNVYDQTAECAVLGRYPGSFQYAKRLPIDRFLKLPKARSWSPVFGWSPVSSPVVGHG